jgi:PAS domain S-box-containing protein
MNVHTGGTRSEWAGPPPAANDAPSGSPSPLADTFRHAVLTLDGSSHIVHANRAATRLLEVNADSLRGRGLEELIGERPRAGLMRRLGDSPLSESTTATELERARSKTTLPVEVSLARLPASGGNERFVVTLRDITTRSPGVPGVSGEVSLLDLAHDAILIRTLPSDTITFWSNGAAEMYGWTAHEAVGQVAHRLLDTRFPQRPQAIAQEVRRTGRWEGQLRKRRRGGLEAVVESRWALLPGRSGRSVIEVDRDVTRRVAMEIALRETEQHLRNVFDYSPLGICSIRLDGLILTANPALQQMLGRPMHSPLALNLAEVVHPLDVPGLEAALQRLREGAPRLAVERRCIRADGSLFWARLTMSVVTDATHALHFCVVMWEDIDERREVDAAMETVNARLREINRAKSALVSGVSHEFRTALTGIQGFSEVLLEEGDLEADESRDLVKDIHSEALRLGRLVDELLDLDRMESGRSALRQKPVDLNALLRSIADRAQRSGPGHQVSVDLDDRLPELDADADRLTQVFTNLLSNAIKYSPTGSLIELSSARCEAGVRVTLRDRGPGIPEDALESVFDQYMRLERESSAGVSGTGLGLPIVRQIVQMHKGRVWAENASDGGAILTVELPKVEPEEVADADRLL